MEPNQKLKFGFAALLTALTLWMLFGLVFSIYTWFEPAPPGSIKVDAYEEIAVTASVLNVALPIAILALLAGFYFARTRRIPRAAPIIFSVVVIGLTIGNICWWRYMDDNHGPSISLTKNHLWWAH